MFLALKEILFNKKRFSLIIFLVVLISYLVYFLTSLAYGLASSYTNGMNKTEAKYILLDNDSNDNVMMSILTFDNFSEVTSTKKAKLGIFPGVASKANKESKLDVYLFGIDDFDFFLPKENIQIISGNEVIVDTKFEEEGYKIGDEIVLSGSDIKLTIKGFAKKATYQTAPIIYLNLDTWNNYRYGVNKEIYNMIVIKDTPVINEGSNLKVYKNSEYYQTLPGYSAQVLTFSMMIIFLILIASFVLGVFIYVLTIQKTSIFGVMKAQGIANSYISRSVVAQTLIITIFGTVIGFILTFISGVFLGGKIPFAANPLFYGVISLVFYLFALVSSLFSVNAVVKIDALKAIGEV